MLSEVLFKLNVKLDQAKHSDSDGHGLENLNPDVRVDGRQAVFAVDVEILSQDGDDCEEHADEAVLEDSDPDNLEYLSANLSTCLCTNIIVAFPADGSSLTAWETSPWFDSSHSH